MSIYYIAPSGNIHVQFNIPEKGGVEVCKVVGVVNETWFAHESLGFVPNHLIPCER